MGEQEGEVNFQTEIVQEINVQRGKSDKIDYIENWIHSGASKDKLFLLGRAATKVVCIVLGLCLIKKHFYLETSNKKHFSLLLRSTMS